MSMARRATAAVVVTRGMRRVFRLSAVAALALGAAFGAGLEGCERNPKAVPANQAERPRLRFFILGGVAGALEPCGCVADMLGGLDHVGAYLNAHRKEAAGALVLGAGPMFFADPKPPARAADQAQIKADTVAAALQTLELTAWAPGLNDFAFGRDRFADLLRRSGAKALAQNLRGADGIVSHHTFNTGGTRVGIIGVALPRSPLGSVEGLSIEDPGLALAAELKRLRSDGVEMAVLLAAMPRGEALRLVEKVPGFQLMIVGKPVESGEQNDEPFPAELVGDTLVVQAPNHAQGLAQVDVYVRSSSYQLADGSGLVRIEERRRMTDRLSDLRARLEQWKKPGSGVDPVQIAQREQEASDLSRALEGYKIPPPPSDRSYFTYEYVPIRASLGSEPRLTAQVDEYYKKVNEHNRVAFSEHRPVPPEPGQARYLGVKECGSCHTEELEFWKTTSHASAYATLSRDHKEYNLDCVSCHVTGYEKPGGSTVAHAEGLENVQCEVCHGPGSLHKESPLNKAKIRRMPDLDLCAASCHHSPHVKEDWSVSTALPKILGPGHGR